MEEQEPINEDASKELNEHLTSDVGADKMNEEAGKFMPDPGMMLSFAAMQMDVHGFSAALIPLFDSYAWQSMGLVANMKNGELIKDLPSAQLAIDCIQFILSKIESTIPQDDLREAHRRLTDLRMNYLTQSKI